MEETLRRPTCPHCASYRVVKNGSVQGRQSYLCRRCYHRFLPDAKRPNHPPTLKHRARDLYQQGWNVTAIARHLGVAIPTVWKWIHRH
nr:MAG: hypothetical protein KatS3mg041_1050 [Bacteroidota bacterium]